MDNFNASLNDRFASIMAVVDAWALDCAGCDCRDVAEAEVLRDQLPGSGTYVATWMEEQLN
jgi:hypothetical protein